LIGNQGIGIMHLPKQVHNSEIYFPQQATALSEPLRKRLERLDRLGRGAFEPLFMAALQKYPEREADLERLFDAAERFIFACRFSFRRADAGDVDFYRLASKVYHARTGLLDAIEEMQRRASEYSDCNRATDRMRELFRDQDGFYSWRALRYFLFEYEQELKVRAGMVESGCGAVVLGRPCRLPPLSSGGALVGRP
jgi:hypothetical protein